MKKVGDRVKFVPQGKPWEDDEQLGTVTHILGSRFEVRWDDGDEYTYQADETQVQKLKA